MGTPLPPELFWVAATAILTGLLWLPYIGDQIIRMGMGTALTNSDPAKVQRSDWALRSTAAHKNAVENLVVFAALALTVNAAGVATETTALACLVFFWLRVAHYVLYTLGVPVLRTLVFAGGVLCQLVLAAAVLT